MNAEIDVISFLKENFNYHMRIIVSNKNQIIGKLVPIRYADIGDESLLDLLTQWRNDNIDAYPSQFNATTERTRKWLVKYILENETKILFLLLNNHDQPIGHMGFASYNNQLKTIEMDNIVRGIKNKHKGIITNALYDLISWTFLTFPINSVYLRVFSDNLRAIELYKRLNFIEIQKIPLMKTTEGKEIKYYEIESVHLADRFFSKMELKRIQHFENYNIKYGE